MERKIHFLKTEREYFDAIQRGKKKFEYRKNDRDFQELDLLILQESINGKLTGRELPALEIRYILYGGVFGLPKDYCIINW